jgi:hypothetical protein
VKRNIDTKALCVSDLEKDSSARNQYAGNRPPGILLGEWAWGGCVRACYSTDRYTKESRQSR